MTAKTEIWQGRLALMILKTLEATFPVLVRLAGTDWFRQTGRAYLRRHPSRAGNIHYIGERFAQFLDDELTDTDHDYFADVARLEWAYQEVLVAAESATLDPNLAKHPDGGLLLSEADKHALVAFLKTLTDEKFLRQ